MPNSRALVPACEPGVVVSDAPPVAHDAGLSQEAAHAVTVTCRDREGLLADLSEHIRHRGVDIVAASVATDTDSGLIVDSFAVRPAAAAPPPQPPAAGAGGGGRVQGGVAPAQPRWPHSAEASPSPPAAALCAPAAGWR